MRKIVIAGLISVLCLSAYALAESIDNNAVFLRHTENGTILVEGDGFIGSSSYFVIDDPSIVWTRYLTDAIFKTTSNTVDGYVFSGTYLNPPEEAALYAPDGGGIPEWTYNGTEFYTDTGDDANILVAIDKDAGGINISKWTGPGNGTPDWTTTFSGYSVSSYGPIAVSDDGSTAAIIASPPGADAHLLLFDTDSSTPLVNYEATGLGFPRYVKINSDGRFSAFIALATLIVFDRDSLDVRYQVYMGASNSALDLSGNGDIVTYGWTTMRVLEWNGSTYQQLWNWAPGGYYLRNIAISEDGSTMVSCWYTTQHNTIKVVVHEPYSSTPLWTYDYPQSSGTYQEVAGDIDITDDGSYFIIGSWGDAENRNPEVHIFQRDETPHVYYTVDMPGSMFSVDISGDGRYATACGKHIHANVSGRGGDIVMIDTDITVTPISIDMIPDNPPVTVPAGGSFTFTGIIQNNTDIQLTGDIWIMLGLPGGASYGPIQQFNNIPLAPNQTITVPGIAQYVPVFAPLGIYDYIAYCGDYPSIIIDEASFEFTVTSPMDSRTDNWNMYKWFDDGDEWVPETSALSGNYPNPFNARTNIAFDIAVAGNTSIEIFDILGRKIETLVDGHLESGPHTITWDASAYSSGVYFYRMRTGNDIIAKKMNLIK